MRRAGGIYLVAAVVLYVLLIQACTILNKFKNNHFLNIIYNLGITGTRKDQQLHKYNTTI